MANPPVSVRDFSLRVLRRGDLKTKLSPAPPGLDDTQPGAALRIEHPARDAGLEMNSGGDRLPRPGELRRASARADCLARFAHHELMAVELFAWALLRWPELPTGLRQGFIQALSDEQRHCRLYLDRLDALGSTFLGRTHSDYFWKHEPIFDAAPAGPRAFLCAMGLTPISTSLSSIGTPFAKRATKTAHSSASRFTKTNNDTCGWPSTG